MSRIREPLGWFRFDVSWWAWSTRALTFAQRGALSELYAMYWVKGELPADVDAIASMSRIPRQMVAAVLDHFPVEAERGVRCCPYLDEDRAYGEAIREARREAGRRGGSAPRRAAQPSEAPAEQLLPEHPTKSTTSETCDEEGPEEVAEQLLSRTHELTNAPTDGKLKRSEETRARRVPVDGGLGSVT